ncbi:hypothetical protein Hte_008392 [Hypoxylon texense]
MSSGKRISPVSIQPLHYADISACARITSSAFSVDPHTIVKGLGRELFDMYTISRSGFLDTLHRKDYIYVKAVDDETGEIVGHAGWAFRGLDAELVPWAGPGDAKPEAEEPGQAQGENAGSGGEDKKDAGGEEEDSIDRLHALESADMQYWLSNVVPTDAPRIFIVGLIVSPSHQSRGVGSALLRHGNAIADDLGLAVWVHSSHQAYEAYRKFGFETVRELDVDLDEYAPRGPRDGEEVMGEKGSGRWGRFMRAFDTIFNNPAPNVNDNPASNANGNPAPDVNGYPDSIASRSIIAVVVAALYYYWWRPKTKKSQPDQYDDSDKYKTSGSISGSDELGVAGTAEAPWQSERPWELASDHIVEAPWQPQRPYEVPA